MDNSKHNSIDPVDLLHEHYEAVEMPDDFRRSLQTSTREVITGHKPNPVIRWAVNLAETVAVVCAQQPVVDASGRTLAAGDRLPVGTAVRTGKSGRVTLVTGRGSELHLDSNSECAFTSNNAATITRGRLFCHSRDKDIAQINTPAGQVHLLGTVVDTVVVDKGSVAVTVVEGKVQLANQHGKAEVDAGRRSMLSASRAPQGGETVNTQKETAWYQGRGEYQSDFGDIAYVVQRENGLVSEVWTMKTDGSEKRRVKSYIGKITERGQWLPGEQWLALETYSVVWNAPDVKRRTAHNWTGHPLISDRTWLLNAVTGQDIPLQLPDGYRPLYMSFSPNAQFMAFSGWYVPDPDQPDKPEGGVWIYNTTSGDITKVFDGRIQTAAVWSPDGRHLAISSGQMYTNDHSLMVIDTQTYEVRNLDITGAGAVFSPDGSKLAYCGDFKSRGSWFHGVPMSGSIFALDLTSGGEPVRVSPPEDDALMPRWSPDGRRIAYCASQNRVCVANADGTELREVHQCDIGTVSKVSWAPKADAVYVSVNRGHTWWSMSDLHEELTNHSSYGLIDSQTLLIAVDSSGAIRVLSHSKENNELFGEALEQTDAAISALREAIFQHVMGKIHTFEGDLDARRKSFTAAADILSGLVWNYPLSGLSTDDTSAYIDIAAKETELNNAEVLHDCCKERMSILGGRIALAVTKHKHFPADLPTLMEWLSTLNWRVNWLYSGDEEHVQMLGLCPGDVGQPPLPFIYTPPADGAEPEVGDVLLRCPQHPDVCYTWDEHNAGRISPQLMREAKSGEFCKIGNSGVPYRFENVGDGQLSVTYHALGDTYDIRGKARLLPTDRVYSDVTIHLGALDEASIARSVDAVGFVDWGRLPEEEAVKAQRELDFCRCVDRFEAGLEVKHCELLKGGFDYKAIENEPAKLLFSKPEGWSCPAPNSALRFETIGPGDIQLYQLKPSGRFRVYGTVRVVQTKQVCTNGWIDKDGSVTYTEQ